MSSQRAGAGSSYTGIGSRGGWRVGVWALLALVLVGALVVGASSRSGPVTPAQRAALLDAQLRCPSCEDLSVANSSAASAVAIRQLVLADANAGVSDQAIVTYLQSRYPGIALRPSTSGLEGIVWFAPLVGFALAAVLIGRLFWRKRSRDVHVHLEDEDRRLVAEAQRAAGNPPGDTAADNPPGDTTAASNPPGDTTAAGEKAGARS